MIARHPFGTELVRYAAIAIAWEFIADSNDALAQSFFPRRRAA
jgi:hypothetical protein